MQYHTQQNISPPLPCAPATKKFLKTPNPENNRQK
uniref:Uncharacterized protein n=1 Tax=Rhizophora mucronata TaxID=61149 RepID=A0A2P2R2D9_RHIMU